MNKIAPLAAHSSYTLPVAVMWDIWQWESKLCTPMLVLLLMIYKLIPRLQTGKSFTKKSVISWIIVFWLMVVSLLFSSCFFFNLDLGWDPGLHYICVVSSL